jgi:hypothetical protein
MNGPLSAILGPLGSHLNYLSHIVIPNVMDYEQIKRGNAEKGQRATPNKYNEFRHFLNAIESLNNILDYYYFENEVELLDRFENVGKFRKNVHEKHAQLNALANMANAYKHCVRTNKGEKNNSMPWAKDLQNPSLHVSINITTGKVEAEYNFEWPIHSNEEVMCNAFRFWHSYQENPSLAVLVGT